MNSDWKDRCNGRKESEWHRLVNSFKVAIHGLLFVVRTERNFQIHLVASSITILIAIALNVSLIKWSILLLLIAGMLSLELVNTAIEKTVDLITDEYHPLAKKAKDISAAAVLVYAIFSVIIGMVLFLPNIIRLFNGFSLL
jgi:undecaprenol kinase